VAKRDVRFFNEFYCPTCCGTPTAPPPGSWRTSRHGRAHVFRAKSVGIHRRLRAHVPRHLNAHALTGDGPVVAWRRGVPLEDMEMFQFHPPASPLGVPSGGAR
jgi:succinate dehydrogenase / fumarate reductase flavoprotein subunit